MLVKQKLTNSRLRNLSKNGKKEKLQKTKNSSDFRHFLSYFSTKKMIHTHKTIANCYLQFAQVEGFFQYPFEPVKQNNRQKTQ